MKSSRKKQRKRRRKKRGADGALNRRVRRQFPGTKVVVGKARDGVKMSAVLEEFIAPYREVADTEDALRKLLTTALVAWNAALLPAQEREAHLEKIFETFPKEVRADGMAVIGELMERKERYFSEYTRMILDYELTDTGENYHLVVISTVDEPAES
jgi:hypothetical protein